MAIRGWFRCIGLALVVTAAGVFASPLSAGQGQDADRDRFIGGWRLLSLEEPTRSGKVEAIDATGMLVFTREGHMSVQVMSRNPQAGAAAGPVQYAQGGYEASFGTYEVDDRTHTFMFHVEGALVRNLVGKRLPRAYTLVGSRLTITSTDSNEHWRAVWEKR